MSTDYTSYQPGGENWHGYNDPNNPWLKDQVTRISASHEYEAKPSLDNSASSSSSSWPTSQGFTSGQSGLGAVGNTALGLMENAINSLSNSQSPLYGGYGYGYGGGYSTSPSDLQKKAAKNLLPITQAGFNNTKDYGNNMNLTLKAADTFNQKFAKTQEGVVPVEWFSNLLKEQSSHEALKQRLGAAMYGSTGLELNRLMQRQHDATAVNILENLENNINDIRLDALQTQIDNKNRKNELAAQMQNNLNQYGIDYASQLSSIHPDLATGKEGDFGKVIDTDGNSLNIPDSLKSNYFTENFDEVFPEFKRIDDIRPPKATQEQQWYDALETAALAKNNKSNNRMAANKRYWDMLTNDYNHRRV